MTSGMLLSWSSGDWTKTSLRPHMMYSVVDLVVGAHVDLAPADAVEVIAGVDADHRLGELRHALRRIGPRPGGRQHADRAHGADLVVEHLMHVAVDVGDLGVGLQHLVHLAPVAHPEVPGRIVLVERIVAEDDDRLGLVPVGERLLPSSRAGRGRRRPTAPATVPSRVDMWPMRSSGVMFFAVQ